MATIAPRAGGAPLDLTGGLDNWVASDSLAAGTAPAAPLWSADDAALYVPFERRGATWLARISSTAPGAARELAGGPRGATGSSARYPTAASSPPRPRPPRRPSSTASRPDGTRRQLTDLYGGWLAGRRLVEPEKLTARNAGRRRRSRPGSIRRSIASPGARYPLVVYIHGGPQGYDGDFFDFDLENQLFPARGWAVLRVNYRGSTSYGETFSRAIWGDWHRREYDDLMAALDQALATRDWIDPARLGIGGWSYGGIMTLWTVGHTDRFKVGVPERFGFDYLSAFGEDQWFIWYLTELGSPLENEATLPRLSPGHLPRERQDPALPDRQRGRQQLPAAPGAAGLPAAEADGPVDRAGRLPRRVARDVDALAPGRPPRRLIGWFGKHLGP